MSHPFLITGMPRSRTAWMAAFLSNGNVLCHHEPLKRAAEISDICRTYSNIGYAHVGVSDSGAGFFMPWIMEHINPRTVVIERDLDEVERSLEAIGLPMGESLPLLLNKLRAFKDHPNVMWVDYDALDNKRVMQKLFWHLLPGVPFDENRYEQFCDLKIEAHLGRLLKTCEKYRNNQLHLMREVIPELERA